MAPAGIITKAAQIEDAVIQRAHIGLAQIDGARIADLAVDTINIKDAAVTQVRSNTNTTGLSADNTSTWANVVSLSWTSARSGVHLQTVRLWSPSNSGGAVTIFWRWQLDGAVVDEGAISNNRPGASGDLRAEEFRVATLAARAHTMRLQMRTSGAHGTLAGELVDLEWYK